MNDSLSAAAKPYVAIPVLLVLAFAVRFPLFFTPTLGWDESTFILFGQHILNGGLPYADYFDIKPPLLFYFFAGAIKVFGATIPSVRIAGTLCVFVASCAGYFLGRHVWDDVTGLFSGIVCTVGMSIGYGLVAMSETIVVAPLTLWAYLVIRGHRRFWPMLAAGALMAVSVLVRSNLAYTCLLSAPCILYLLYVSKARMLKPVIAYAVGGFGVLLLTLYPFYSRNALQDLYRDVVLIPMSASNAAFSKDGIGKLVAMWNDYIDPILVLSVCGMLFCFMQMKKYDKILTAKIIFIASVLVSIVWSFLGGKVIYAHYILQLIPMLALFAGYALCNAYRTDRKMRILSYALLLYVMMLPVLPLRSTAVRLIAMYQNMDGEFHVVESDESQTARYIRDNLPPGRKIWVMDEHIIYWLLSMSPPTKYVIHPPKVVMPESVALASDGASSALSEIAATFDKKPYFIVRSVRNWYIKKGTPEGDLIDETMDRDYRKVAQFGYLCVYRIASD